MVLSQDSRRLYVAVLDGGPRGIAEIDTEADSIVRRLGTDDAVPQEVAISPSGRRLFLTTQDRWEGSASDNLLVDTFSLTILARLARPRQERRVRYDGGVAFHPNGNLVFVARDTGVDVYLNREDYQ
jgi:DNA-binding beta-propeller fold protein YncE